MNDRPASKRLECLYQPFIDSFVELNAFAEKVWPPREFGFPPSLSQTLHFFVGTIISRARAAFILLQAGSYWESEIVLRSLLEAAVRCLTFARRSNVDELLGEFWVELQSSSDRKAALRAAMAQKLIPETSTENPIFDALQNPNWFEVEPTVNKRRRRHLDQKWSLPELVKKLEEESETIKPIIGLSAMMHGYGLQSEILHVSARYYDLLLDRVLREDDLIPLENTHYCRQMTDAVQLAAFCISLSLERLGIEAKDLQIPIEIANRFGKLAKPYQIEFDRSQGFA